MIAVGLSGGADSVALLHYLKNQGNDLMAIHVNHNISPNADFWENFCKEYCEKLNVPFFSHSIKLPSSGNLEENARIGRYEIFKNCDADTIAVAHHAMDQIETVFMKLFRGCGVRGSSGMWIEDVFGTKKLIRPFLNWTKDDILNYCEENNLRFINDESNLNNDYDRNFLRNSILPKIFDRIPFAFKGMMKMISNAQDTHKLVDDLALIDIENCTIETNILDWRKVIELPEYRVKNLFHYILYSKHENVSGEYLCIFVKQIMSCKIDSNTEYVGKNIQIKKKGKKIFIKNK